MKTTMEISSPLLSAVKKAARSNNMTFRQAVEAALSNWVSGRRSNAGSFHLKDASSDCGLAEEFSTLNWEKISKLVYGEDK